MKVLLDECVDARLAQHLTLFNVATVAEIGWAGMTNGRLLSRAEKEFDVFVTVDGNLAFQQNLPKFSLAVILLHAKTNRLLDLVQLVPELVKVIPRASKGMVISIGG